MNLSKLISGLELSLDKEEVSKMNEKTNEIVSVIQEGLSNKGKNVQVFVGGSFAKGTISKGQKKDVDLFVRFSKDQEEGLERELLKIIKKIKGYKLKKVHGSRNYFQLEDKKDKDLSFEIVPVLKVSSPKKAENVTDLSYFHVRYLKKKTSKNRNLISEIIATKRFMKNAGVYGAESYIQGFSGYAVECLIIAYGSFEKLVKEVVKTNEKIVLDPEKHYKNKAEIMLELNESKTQGPIVLVDPTWKERNVLAALSRESFETFRNYSKKFLEKPSKEYFASKPKDKSRKFGPEKSIEIRIFTKKQEGDVAGTKMKKFSLFILERLGKFFEINEKEFEYSGGKESKLFISFGKPKKIIRVGPELHMVKNVEKFKERNKNYYVKGKRVYSRIDFVMNPKDFIKKFLKKNKSIVRSMDISKVKIK